MRCSLLFLCCCFLVNGDVTLRNTVKIGTFNIQVFGVTKASKEPVLQALAQIVRRYDVLAVQEVRDSSGTSIPLLLSRVNNVSAGEPIYNVTLSARLGRSSSKEQYAVFYRVSSWSFPRFFVYNDTQDVFEREPFIVKAVSPLVATDFSLIMIHTKPENAVSEISGLADVYADAAKKLSIKNSLILGDFNADCSYVPKYKWPSVRLRNNSDFVWLIHDDIDTTTKGTNCSYDRIVGVGDTLLNQVVPGSVRVFRYDLWLNLTKTETTAISDHYPVELDLWTVCSGGGQRRVTDATGMRKCPSATSPAATISQSVRWSVLSACLVASLALELSLLQ